MELVVWDQPLCHCTTHSLIHPQHHGWIQVQKFVNAVRQLQELATTAADKGDLSVMVDQKAAFDLDDHWVLIEKLEAYNFQTKTTAWFRS